MSWNGFDAFMNRIAAGARALTDAVPRILSNPRAYPREAMLLAAIVGLFLIVLALSGVNLADWIRSRRARGRVGVKRKSNSRRLSALATGLAVGVIITIIAGIAPTSARVGEACGACHATREAVTSWQSDEHASVSCFACHAAPGVLGALQASLAGVQSFVTGSRESGGSTHAGSCLKCHFAIAEGTVGGSIRVRHAEIIAAGTRCVECHPEVGHSDLGSPTPSFVRSMMSRCTPCHDGRTAPERCETCHVSGPLDESKTPKRATAISTAGCTGCHEAKTAQRCIACHGLELPHPPTFMRSHAALSYANPALCAKCHETASAETGCRCHSIDINIHGTYEEWFPVHGSRARSSGPGGCMCHNDNEFIVCAACHERFPWSP